MRDKDKSVFRMKHLENPFMLGAFFLGLALQAMVTEIPYFVQLFGTARLSLQEWCLLLGISSIPLIAHELLLIPGKLLGMKKRQ